MKSQRRAEKKKRGKLRSVRFHLAVRFSQVNGSSRRGRDLKFTTTLYSFVLSTHGTIPASLQTGKTFLLGNTVQRWVVVAASSVFARLFSMTHELWIWCVHVSSPTMPRFSGVTRKCDEESFLSQRRPDSIRI